MNTRDYITNHIFFSHYSDVHIVNAGYEKSSAKKNPRTLSDFKAFSMHLVMSGAGYLKIGGQTFRVEKNSLFFLFPKTPLEYFPDKRTPWKYSWIDFTGTKVNDFLKRMDITKDNPVLTIENPATFNKIFLRNVADCLTYKDFSDVIATATFYNVLVEIFKQRYSHSANTANDTTASINRILDYINTHYTNPDLSIDIVASHVGYHRVSVARLFRQKTGVTFQDHLTKVRLQAAVMLFDNGETSISAVSNAVGYTDPLYFSKVFKKYNTISPREHIKKITSENDNGTQKNGRK